MPNLVFTHKELKDLRVKLLFLQLENEVILNELIEQSIDTKKELDTKKESGIGIKYTNLLYKIREKQNTLKEIRIELKNIQLINELNCFTVL